LSVTWPTLAGEGVKQPSRSSCAPTERARTGRKLILFSVVCYGGRNQVFLDMKLKITKSSLPLRLLPLALFATISVSGAAAVVAQTVDPQPPAAPEKKTEPAAKDPKLPFTLRVTNDQIIGLSLKAKDISLGAIAAELSKQLKIPVMVTPIAQKHMVTVNFTDLVIEPAMQMLAPQVFIDYEIDTTPGKQPRPVGIYLQGYNEPAPAVNAVVKGNSDVMVIEGDTEEGLEPKKEEEEDLKITFEKGQLSVKSKKQPLIVVLYGIANQLGIPLEVKTAVEDLVTVNIIKSSLESALQELAPNIKLYVRADLMIGNRQPLRMVLVGPEKKS
jgi:hypothetical protein